MIEGRTSYERFKRAAGRIRRCVFWPRGRAVVVRLALVVQSPKLPRDIFLIICTF